MHSLKAAKAQLLLQVEAAEVVVARQAALQEAPLAASQVSLRACHSQECRPKAEVTQTILDYRER
jgi:hypothetical protein